jgi:hypothetical protein
MVVYFEESVVLCCPKSFDHPKDNEDRAVIGTNERVAIADGVSSAIFSAEWAERLVTSVVDFWDPSDSLAPTVNWLRSARDSWAEMIKGRDLGYFQRAKLEQVSGGFATLLALKFEESDSEGIFSYRALAIGDTCLLHFRNRELLAKFPLQTPLEFECDPSSLCSREHFSDQDIQWKTTEGIFTGEDTFLLCTDALAKWIYTELETNSDYFPADLIACSPREFKDWVQAMRVLGVPNRIRVDDTTLMILSKPVSYLEEANGTSSGNRAATSPRETTQLDSTIERSTSTEHLEKDVASGDIGTFTSSEIPKETQDD